MRIGATCDNFIEPDDKAMVVLDYRPETFLKNLFASITAEYALADAKCWSFTTADDLAKIDGGT